MCQSILLPQRKEEKAQSNAMAVRSRKVIDKRIGPRWTVQAVVECLLLQCAEGRLGITADGAVALELYGVCLSLLFS